MSVMKPKVTAVHDGSGRMALFIDESLGQDAVVSRFAPRYQRIGIHGEPACVFFDTRSRSFVIIPVFYRGDFIDRPLRYQHIVDLDWLPGARPTRDAPGLYGALWPTGSSDAPGPSRAPDLPGTPGAAGAAGSEEMDIDQEAQATTASLKSDEKIPRPPNAWIIFRSEKAKKVREENPTMTNGEVSKEVSRLWHASSQEVQDFYRSMAEEAKKQHQLKYPNYRYKPTRK
uniref:MATA_HMG-box n=1 Tax=Stenocarpella maydis TaxID=238245 RepID=A0A1B1UZG1_9PEZI|nr:MATA_HMG-box [Stenocarpella maydis]